MPVNPNAKVLYRYEDAIPSQREYNLKLHKYKILSTTPQGYWIERVHWLKGDIGKKWVHADGTRSFAFDTEEKALYSFIQRKRHNREHILRRFRQANYSYHLARNKRAKDTIGDKLVFDTDKDLSMEMDDLEDLNDEYILL